MRLLIFFLLIMMPLFTGIFAQDIELLVFYKERPPSLQVLEKVKDLLINFQEGYEIKYYNIEEEENEHLLEKYSFPGTHFPFAIVINDRYTAKIKDRLVSFIHFPHFMKGIGRHEGNWSLSDLKTVLEDNSLLHSENILPVLDKSEQTTSCEDH